MKSYLRCLKPIVLAASAMFLLLNVSCFGGPVESSWRVRWHGPDPESETGYSTRCGSGTAIGLKFVVTNSHVVEHQKRNVEIHQPLTGKAVKCVVVHFDPQPDLALLYVTEEDSELEWSPIGGMGESREVGLLGYGRNGILRYQKMPVGSVGISNTQIGPCPVLTGVSNEQGDSGGGVFNEHGKLVGVNWGKDPQTGGAVITSLTKLNEFCDQYETATGWSCRGDVCRPIYGGGIGSNNGGARPMVPVNPSNPPQFNGQPSSPPQTTPMQPRQPIESFNAELKDIAAELKQIAQRINEQNTQCESLTVEINTIKQELVEARAEIVAVAAQAPAEGPPGPAGETPKIDYDTIVSSVVQQIGSHIDQRFTVIENSIANAAEPYRRLLYFTSDGHDACVETDQVARQLRDEGYPITFIYLEPQEITVGNVPRTYMLPEQNEVGGTADVLAYLRSLQKQ